MDSSPRRFPWPWLLAGCGAAIVLVPIVICGGLLALGSFGHQGGVRYANDIEPYAEAHIEEHRLLEPGERVISYYDGSVSLDASTVYLLTDRRLVHDLEGRVSSVALADVVDITVSDAPMATLVDVSSPDTIMHLEIAAWNGAEGFVQALRRQRDLAQR